MSAARAAQERMDAHSSQLYAPFEPWWLRPNLSVAVLEKRKRAVLHPQPLWWVAMGSSPLRIIFAALVDRELGFTRMHAYCMPSYQFLSHGACRQAGGGSPTAFPCVLDISGGRHNTSHHPSQDRCALTRTRGPTRSVAPSREVSPMPMRPLELPKVKRVRVEPPPRATRDATPSSTGWSCAARGATRPR